MTDVLDLPLDEAGDDASGPTITDTASALRLGVMRLARRLRVERNRDDLTFNQLSALGTLRRHGPLRRALLGGVTHRLMHHCPSPLLVLPRDARPAAFGL